jgi:D-amino peptidase
VVKILIAADMEGVTGVVHWDQVDSQHPEYQRFRKLMTGDVNAAIRGAFAGGADEVVVADGHGSGRNILIEELDARARLNSGSPSPLSMVQGAQGGVSAAMFVGYHACVGSQNGILDHTWSGSTVASVRVNGKLMGETAWNASVCGHFGAPVIMVSGDQTVCAEARALLGEIETAEVKQATGRMAAECLPPAVSQRLIEEAALRAVRRLREGQAPAPLKVSTPVTLSMDLVTADMADRAMLMPGMRRAGGRQIEFTAADVPSAYGLFRALVSVARG